MRYRVWTGHKFLNPIGFLRAIRLKNLVGPIWPMIGCFKIIFLRSYNLPGKAKWGLAVREVLRETIEPFDLFDRIRLGSCGPGTESYGFGYKVGVYSAKVKKSGYRYQAKKGVFS